MDNNNRTNRDLFEHIQGLMSKGLVAHSSGRKYYTGYSYSTLYDWDQYFEGIVQLYMGYGTEYLQNSVCIFLEAQQKNWIYSTLCSQCSSNDLSSNGWRNGETFPGTDHTVMFKI